MEKRCRWVCVEKERTRCGRIAEAFRRVTGKRRRETASRSLPAGCGAPTPGPGGERNLSPSSPIFSYHQAPPLSTKFGSDPFPQWIFW